MTCEKFDPNCPGCRPAIMDPRTGRALPKDDPIVVTINEVWDAAPREEQEACWRIWVKNGREYEDMKLAAAFMSRVQAKLNLSN